MRGDFRSHKDGRLWVQFKKFEPYELLLCSGITDVTDPSGALTQAREPSAGTRRASEIVDILRGDPDLPGFSVETRLFNTKNYLLGMRCDLMGAQAHLGRCGRPDRYNASAAAVHWGLVKKGDIAIDRLALIEGDDAAVGVTAPFSAKNGPTYADFGVYFTGAEEIAETEAVLDMAFLGIECFEDCQSQEDEGENGYAVTEAQAGSPTNIANVWATEDTGESWDQTSTNPFGAAEDISSVVVMGVKYDHRIIVSRGTADAGNPAEIAYSEVDTWTAGVPQTTWINVDVGATNGEFINHLLWIDWRNLFACTDQGNVYKSEDGGASWALVFSEPAAQSQNELTGLGDGTVWVGGNANTFNLSEDYGDTWTEITGLAAWAGFNVVTVHVTHDGTLFAGNSNGDMIGTYDQGTQWTVLNLQGVAPINVPRIRGWGNDFLWVIIDVAGPSGRVLRSTDGGATFELWRLNIDTDNLGLNALAVINPNFVYVGGEPVGGQAFIAKTYTDLIGL